MGGSVVSVVLLSDGGSVVSVVLLSDGGSVQPRQSGPGGEAAPGPQAVPE